MCGYWSDCGWGIKFPVTAFGTYGTGAIECGSKVKIGGYCDCVYVVQYTQDG